MQWVAILLPQHCIQALQVGPQIWLSLRTLTDSRGHPGQIWMSGRQYSAVRAWAHLWHYLRKQRELWVAMGGHSSTSTLHSSLASNTLVHVFSGWLMPSTRVGVRNPAVMSDILALTWPFWPKISYNGLPIWSGDGVSWTWRHC